MFTLFKYNIVLSVKSQKTIFLCRQENKAKNYTLLAFNRLLFFSSLGKYTHQKSQSQKDNEVISNLHLSVCGWVTQSITVATKMHFSLNKKLSHLNSLNHGMIFNNKTDNMKIHAYITVYVLYLLPIVSKLFEICFDFL